MPDEEKKVPSITITLKDQEMFQVAVEWYAPSLPLVRAMLSEAVKSVDRHIADQEALEFGERMGRIQAAAAAMRKGKGPLNL